MEKKYILTMDQGTTSSRAIIFDHSGSIVDISQREFKQIYPKPGWVEHDPNEIWYTQASAVAEVVSKADINGKNIAAIGITNQRETTIIWDHESGQPIYNAIVWQDRRTTEFCNQLKKQGLEDIIQEKTGLVIDSYFSASKIKWILDNVPGARKKAKAGKLCFGTVDSWLIFRLTNHKVHVTDSTNASRTMLFDINKLCWDEELLRIFDIPKEILPEVKSSSEVYTESATTLFASKLPIAGVIGDQHSALFGQMCIKKGMLKTTYGTGCFMMMNIGPKPVKSKNKLLNTIAWELNGKVTYALEGSVFVGGAVVQWLRDELGFIQKASESESLALSVDDSGGVVVVPALAGLGAPHWDQSARGSILGLTRGSSKAHITRAALESIAYQVSDVIKAKENDTDILVNEMRVDGGASANDFIMQFQADILGANVVRPHVLETTALGAAYMAGLAVGYWDNVETLEKQWQAEKVFERSMQQNQVDLLLSNWNKALSRSKNWDNV